MTVTRAIGTVMDERFEVRRLLGEGGMGAVYEAYDRSTERLVALKILSAQFARTDADMLRERFRREIRVMASLKHPNVATVFAAGLDDDTFWYAMELLDAPSLADVVDDGPLDSPRVAAIVGAVADALDYVHERGVVHRDVTPRNILLVSTDRPVLVDFGLARDVARTAMTATGTILGTPLYLSPEQFEGNVADGRSDLYQLGMVAYELLTGRGPFEAADLVELARLVRTEAPPRPSTVQAGCPAPWDDILDKLLAKDPDCRHQRGAELSAAVRPLAGAVDVATVSRSAVPSSTASSRRPGTTRLLRRRRWLQWSFTAAALTVLALAGLLLRPSPRTADVCTGSFDARPGPGSVTIVWRSSVPYRSVVHLTPVTPHGASDGPLTVAARRSSSTDHVVEATGLHDGEQYDVRIVLPDGSSSLPQRVRAGRLELDIVAATTTEAGLELVVAGPGIRSIHARSADEAGLSYRFTSAAETPERWCTVLPATKVPLTDVVLDVVTPGGVRRPVTVTGLLARQLSPRLAAMESIDPRVFAAAIGEDERKLFYDYMGEAERRLSPLTPPQAVRRGHEQDEHRRHLADRIGERLATEGRLDDYRLVRALAPLVFEHELAPRRLRERTYLACMRMVRLFIYLDRLLLPVSFVEPLPTLGDYGLTEEPPFPVTAMHTVALHGPPAAPIRLGMLSMIHRDQTHRWTATFELDDVPTGARPVVRLRTRVFKYIAATARLNDGPAFLIFDRPMFGRKLGDEVSLWQRMPRDVLMRGTNRLTLEFEWVFLDVIPWSVDVAAVDMFY